MEKKAKRTKRTKSRSSSKRAKAGAPPQETTGKDPKEKRRTPRYPGNRVWSDATREQHRVSRDQAIEDAGLVTDRMIEKKRKEGSDD